MKKEVQRALVLLSLSVLLTVASALAPFATQPASGQAGFVKVAVMNEGQAASGLQEALMAGTADAVRLVGRPDGYFGNAAIKILLPQSLQPLATGLGAIGYGPQIDQFVLSMNRAAEAAAPQAEPIFKKAIMSMTFSDAQRIVSRGGHSATDYFKAKTFNDLRVAFTPTVKKTMDQYAVVKQYDDLMARYRSGPFAMGGMFGNAVPSLDVYSYVVQKSLDGLFYVVGQEEIKIRTNPAAQVTPLLRQVFGGLR